MKDRGKGLVHIYCGDGKGKTTCGMGLCLRAAGAGKRVIIYQFMKDNSTSERKALAAVHGITLVDGPSQVKFSFQMSSSEKEEARKYYDTQLRRLFALAASESCGLLFLDEAIYAVRAGLLDEQELLGCLDSRPAPLEVVLTGQDPSERLLARADYVTEMKKIRHPYERGLQARPGIEY